VQVDPLTIATAHLFLTLRFNMLWFCMLQKCFSFIHQLTQVAVAGTVEAIATAVFTAVKQKLLLLKLKLTVEAIATVLHFLIYLGKSLWY